jgi:hypothetical protein
MKGQIKPPDPQVHRISPRWTQPYKAPPRAQQRDLQTESLCLMLYGIWPQVSCTPVWNPWIWRTGQEGNKSQDSIPGVRPRVMYDHESSFPLLYQLLPGFLRCGKGPFYDISCMGDEVSNYCFPRQGQKDPVMPTQSLLTSWLGTIKGHQPTPGPNNVF